MEGKKIDKKKQDEIFEKVKNAISEKNKADQFMIKTLERIRTDLKLEMSNRYWKRLMKNLCEPYFHKSVVLDKSIWEVKDDDSDFWYGVEVMLSNLENQKVIRIGLKPLALDTTDNDSLRAEFIKSNVYIIEEFLLFYTTELEIQLDELESDPHYTYETEIQIKEKKEEISKVKGLRSNIFPMIIKEISKLEEM